MEEIEKSQPDIITCDPHDPPVFSIPGRRLEPLAALRRAAVPPSKSLSLVALRRAAAAGHMPSLPDDVAEVKLDRALGLPYWSNNASVV